MSRIELTNVTKRWGQFYAVDNLSMVIEDNAFVTLLGPSGCGKTTTLRMIAGLETPTSGRITIDGVPVFDSQRGINVSANKRKVGFLFQNYALWPNMTVYQNISFGLTNIKEEMDEIDFDARAAARMIEILQKPQDVVRAINECVDKKKKLNMDKAYLRLIDLYEISLFTAKALMGMKLHEAGDPKAAAAQEIKKLEEKLAAAKAKAEKNGCTLGADYVLMKGGQPVRAVRKMTEEEIDLIVRRVARIVKIGMFMDRYPSELSGGQQQRVAIARTLAPNPKVLFMDEPLSNLDAKLRLEMRSELQRLHLQTGSTFVYVTHDQMEAMTLPDGKRRTPAVRRAADGLRQAEQPVRRGLRRQSGDQLHRGAGRAEAGRHGGADDARRREGGVYAGRTGEPARVVCPRGEERRGQRGYARGGKGKPRFAVQIPHREGGGRRV